MNLETNRKNRKTPSQIEKIGEKLLASMKSCQLCPMECRVDRLKGELGKCNSTAEAKVASYNLHFGEEPPLSSGGGSGTIFLSNCSLFCKYCQNYPISQFGNGSFATTDELARMMSNLQERGAENINFVTPDHMLPMLLIALAKARKNGLKLPIVYNCSGYAKVEILKHLDGIIDVYLVDMRYNDDKTARRYSGCDNYVSINRAAVKEMFRQVGNLLLTSRGMAESGVIVRHLVLPGRLSGSEGIFQYLANEISDEIFVSLMSQYFPAYKANESELIGRRLFTEEFEDAVELFYEAGLKNGYIQEYSYETTE